jgi:hypothetical protein
MMFLSQENAVFKAIYTDMCNHFYAALNSVLARLDPNQPALSYRLRALLMTSLIDGAPIQLAEKDHDDFIAAVAAHALRMGMGH